MTHGMIRIAGCLAASVLMVVMTAAPAQAQGRVRVNIPFAFEAGTEWLAAGPYILERSTLSGPSLLKVHSVELNKTMVFQALPILKPNAAYNPRLVFEVLGGQYRLAEIWTAGNEEGVAVNRSREQALIAHLQGKVTTVALALRSDPAK